VFPIEKYKFLTGQ